MNWWSAASVVISVIMMVVSVTAMIVTLRNKSEKFESDLKKEEQTTAERLKDMEEKIEEAVAHLNEALTLIRLLSTEQALINKVVSGTLNSMTDRVTVMESRINAHDVAISVVREVLKRQEQNGD